MGQAPEMAAPLLLRVEDADAEWSSRPHRIALFVEPSPFAYISGYKNRFQNFIKHLREMGDEVLVVTTHKGAPEEFHGAKVIGSWSFPCPLYQNVPLSLALSPRIFSAVSKFKPDIIHATSPGVMVTVKNSICIHCHLPCGFSLPHIVISGFWRPCYRKDDFSSNGHVLSHTSSSVLTRVQFKLVTWTHMGPYKMSPQVCRSYSSSFSSYCRGL
uniref:Glycosyltransferase subfamily 4-like N-terminal domain-containing protein n=1 Tax=Aegilops tauschii subsp. strangulata TaxID=200361 RepID=A0A453IG04_AEGTS